MNYEEAVAYIDETPKFTKKNSLDHTKECLRRLGNPQDKFKVIHVAGTNGKGSTCAFLTSILREAGYSCGLFTSPHLVEINERFQINEVNIDNDTFLKVFESPRRFWPVGPDCQSRRRNRNNTSRAFRSRSRSPCSWRDPPAAPLCCS